MATSNVAISYARFSSKGQAEGDSLRRQTEASQKWAAENGLVLDTQLSMTDLGISAYDGSNVERGALGGFLKAIEQGQIPAGATLIVESLDRLSRDRVLEAQAQFTTILRAGIRIVTLIDRQVYTYDSVSNNPGQLIISLMIMFRANEESATKSARGKAAWSNKKKLAISQGLVMTKKTPHWIEVTPERKFKLIPARVKVVKKMIKWAEAGIGNSTIIRKLHAEEVEAWSSSGKWEPSYVQKVLTNPALYGAIDLDGEVKEGYYPAVVDKEKFVYLQSLRSARATTKTTNRGGKVVTNLFSGLLKCGYCGSSMNVAGHKSLKTGYERKYVACHGARTGATACTMRMWYLDELEPKLLYWLSGLDVGKLMGSGEKSQLDAERSQLALLVGQKVEAAKRVANVMGAIEEGATGMVKRLQELEGNLAQIEKQLEAQERKVAVETMRDGSGSTRRDALIQLFKALKHTQDEVELRALREQLSAAVASLVEMVGLYPRGPSPDGEKGDRYMVVLLKNGKSFEVEAPGLNA